ncbi:hypothetical protein O181_028154 [Austropuccinia psidii MF-1]|uniref:Uncharacterized protein n=1 Tax=Austropuccinia psidii MF-1 TaxID=1389203 RepID=A0A9Q3H3A5_9BASI|nr:hypothetical protein [Austropuccinia psidii MF-1]
MKEGGNVSLYIANFRSLVSRIGDWGEWALIYHFRSGLASRILDQLASHPSSIDSLQDLIDITLELDTRYHERQKEKIHHQEKKREASKANSSHPQDSSASSNEKKKNCEKRDKPHSSLLSEDFKLMNSEKERRIKEGDRSNSFSNDFSSAKSCAHLVGDSRTPSIPSSVHIPPLNSHQSFPSSINEVFKEIEDVGEDNYVSQLHLLFGNMDIPPSSYHDSLEELWDEEEEPK